MKDTNTYLNNILDAQTLDEKGPELKNLRKKREEVEALLREKYGSAPIIRYGGSKAKGTMILKSYDLDIICYWPNEDDSGGSTLEEIYNNVAKELGTKYYVEKKRSALRIQTHDIKNRLDLHIDVVPGRFTDEKQSDAYLYQESGDKKRLKSNLDIHLSHVRDSGFIPEIRLMKLWRVNNGLTSIKNFVLELLVIKLLKDTRIRSLDERLQYVWGEFKERKDTLTVEDPANPQGNDLSSLLDATVRMNLASFGEHTLLLIDSLGWESVFGKDPKEDETNKVEMLSQAAASISKPAKPWFPA